jgi:hypothetical protein
MAIAKMMGRMGKMVKKATDPKNQQANMDAGKAMAGSGMGPIARLRGKMGDEDPTPAKPRGRGAVLKAAGMGARNMAKGYSKGGSADKTGRAMKKTTADAKGRAMKKTTADAKGRAMKKGK